MWRHLSSNPSGVAGRGMAVDAGSPAEVAANTQWWCEGSHESLAERPITLQAMMMNEVEPPSHHCRGDASSLLNKVEMAKEIRNVDAPWGVMPSGIHVVVLHYRHLILPSHHQQQEQYGVWHG